MSIGIVPYSPLGGGFLTGSVKPASEYPAEADLNRVHEILPEGSFGSCYPEGMMPAW